MSENREQILTCARDIFLDEGMSHFSMRKVATCVGVSATALYRHFANKEELLFHVLLHGFHIFAGYLQRVDETLPPLQVLEDTINAYADFALREQAYYEMMFMTSEQMTGLKQLSKEGASEMRHTFDILHKRIDRCIENGDIAVDDSYRTAFAVWAFAHGQIALFINGRSGLKRKEFVEVYRHLMNDYIQRL